MSDVLKAKTGFALQAADVHKTYGSGEFAVRVLQGASLLVNAGERVAIVGASGSGKSTLLHVLGALDQPDAGTVEIGGQRLDQLSETARGEARNRLVGFVYQFHHLLPEFSALENVAMPLRIRRLARKSRAEIASQSSPRRAIRRGASAGGFGTGLGYPAELRFSR
jgi:lipoprotein-releasing system ATP-binding protein